MASWQGETRRLSGRLCGAGQRTGQPVRSDFDEKYIDEAVRLVDIMLAHFADREAGGFFYTADDHEQLIARHKDIQDSSVPSGNALAATVLCAWEN